MAGAAVPASAATPTDTRALRDAVNVGNDKSGIRSHLKQLQLIADSNARWRTRRSATPAPSTPWVADQDYEYMEFSGNGAVTNRAIQVIDFTPRTNTASASDSGC